ncbi:PH domain-containing protein [Kordiimonas sp. SCSIO 12610]|uniref:PH domain-containing protein n=1 Tax=Kordiimonas sp. SCSIO 12610 TaxID=2829597 RepID=UPI00210DEC46|nr:PH domain-containing protein [Kordiimonas sp. SCSIO 12610]UTW54570.1 PH domain-containing protein [Kordiimonas sp. SCSIO 12610]
MTDRMNAFTNETIITDGLPRAEDVPMKPLSPSYPTIQIIMTLIMASAPTLVATVLYLVDAPVLITYYVQWIYIGAAILLIAGYFWCHLDAKHRGYAIREQDILYKSGVIWRTVVAVPFNRLQHAELHRGPLERLFNLSSLRLFTAGGLKADMTIPALPETDAIRVREYVLSRASLSA